MRKTTGGISAIFGDYTMFSIFCSSRSEVNTKPSAAIFNLHNLCSIDMLLSSLASETLISGINLLIFNKSSRQYLITML